jgi:hypothetical protein
MASTYSPSLKITLPGDGDQAGLWGQTTNTNLGTLVEQAITGVVSITMSDANYTLTSFNGVSDEARNAVLVVTGTNAAVRDLIPPVAEKLYTIVNNTTGGFAIRVIGASGTGVNIPNGATCLVYCDGTNFINGLSGSAGNFTISGSLTSTGNANVGGNLAVTGTTTLSGASTAVTVSSSDNSTNIATTAYVKTLVGTPGTMASQNANAVAITGGTINGVTGTASGFTAGNVSGTVAVANGGTGVITSTGTGSTVLSASPTLTNPSISGAIVSSMNSSVITSGSAITTTSGTTALFSGIPSWVKRISFIFSGVGTGGSSSNFLIQLGTGGGIVSSGYASGASGTNAGFQFVSITSSAGFLLTYEGSNGAWSGIVTINLLGSNTWASSGIITRSSNGFPGISAGSIALGATLTQAQLTTVSGDTFSAGSVNIQYD